MKKILLSGILALAPMTVAAGTIDTTGSPGSNITFGFENGADVVGGSFVADADTLVSFTLNAFANAGGAFRAVVFGFDGGSVPSSLLWESADVIGTSTATEYSFAPGLSLTSGDEYFIGLDNGNMTSVVGSGSYGVNFTSSDLISGDNFYVFNGGSTFATFGGFNDINTRIVMENTAAVPLPASVPLLGGALMVLGGLRRKARKAA